MELLQKGIFVTATDTEVGKTFVSAVLLKILLEKGVQAAYFKPVATGCEEVSEGLVSEDLVRIKQLTGMDLSSPMHCPYQYRHPLAPLAAARLEGRPIDIERIHAALEDIMKSQAFVVVEGVGGVMVPITDDIMIIDIMKNIGLPAIVVARPGLGTINHTLLTINALQQKGINVLGFVTNGDRDELDLAVVTSPSLIEQFSGTKFLGHVPVFEGPAREFSLFVSEKCSFFDKILFGI